MWTVAPETNFRVTLRPWNVTDLTEHVDRDPQLNGDEKETTITMGGQDNSFTVYSAKPTVVKSLLDHDHFELDWARVVEDGAGHSVADREVLPPADGDIVAVEGSMPVGVLTVKSKPRANDNQSSVVNSETVDSSVFE